MKKFRIYFIVMLFMSIGVNVSAQDLLYSNIEGKLSAEQRDEFKNTDKSIKKAEKYVNQAEKIESKYAKYKGHKKKSKRKKWEKKTWEAKKLRISAEKENEKAYVLAMGIYSELIQNSEFYFEDDKTKATELDTEAQEELGEAKDKIKKFRNKSKKKDLQKVMYETLVNTLGDSKNLKKSALQKQYEALDVIIEQDAKKEQVEKDRLAWQNAQDVNTETAYQEYIDNFPQGKYVADARDKLQQLADERRRKEAEEAERLNNLNTQNETGYTFKVQIAASAIPLSQYSIKRRYANDSQVERTRVGRFYKYRVGSYQSYNEAAQARNQIRYNAPGAFVVVFDKDGNQVQVTDDMKK